MQRVLSFQMARGFGESSEFVTKRMCFSFLFSVGFLCLLCGFLTGRFAAGRAVDSRAEKTRLQLAGNGLENNEYLRGFLVEKIHGNSLFTTNYSTDPRDEETARRMRQVLLDLEFFHRVEENESCIMATLRGSREPDRHVVLSASGEGVMVIVELSIALKSLKEDYEWNPRRTIKFIVSLESGNPCDTLLNDYDRRKTVSYIELNVQSISGRGHFVTTGSDIVQSSILESGNGVENRKEKSQLGNGPTTTEACREIICEGFTGRLRLDIPNAVVTFASSGDATTDDNGGGTNNIINYYRRVLGEIIGTSIWRLSEMTLFKWDPSEENKRLIEILRSLNVSEELSKSIDTAVDKIDQTSHNIKLFNQKIDTMDTISSLEVRMANDLSLQVRRCLLCNDGDSRSRTDVLRLQQLSDQSTSAIDKYLRALILCYETANQLLEENVT